MCQGAAEFYVSPEPAEFRAPALVVATGGLSIPKMGADRFRLRSRAVNSG